jgi:hypothetical protein
MKEMVQLHVNHRTIDSLNRRGIANSALHSFTRSRSVTTMDAPESDLSNDNGMFSSWCWSFNVRQSSREDLNVLLLKGFGEHKLDYG